MILSQCFYESFQSAGIKASSKIRSSLLGLLLLLHQTHCWVGVPSTMTIVVACIGHASSAPSFNSAMA